MPRDDIDRIREKIRLRQYDMSAHAMEEMAEDLLTILDIEEAVLRGQIIRVEKDLAQCSTTTLHHPQSPRNRTLFELCSIAPSQSESTTAQTQ